MNKGVFGGAGKIIGGVLTLSVSGCVSEMPERPNILICIADDASFDHLDPGCDWISTPGLAMVADQGILFSNVYTPNAKSAPSRACLLTGRNPWQLKEAANHFCFFPAEFKTFPEVLGDNGYYVGFTGKGWSPGDPGTVDGKPRELTGRSWNRIKTKPPAKYISNVDYASNFKEFLNEKPDESPFCFWYGGFEPHRKYEYGSSLKAGKKVTDIDYVPGFLPDTEDVRIDMLDYGLEIEYFDLHLKRIIDILKESGELDNTFIIVTSDNGMPFPRAKSDEYEYSNHMPMAVMWRKGITGYGRKCDQYISFIDIAPTLLDIAGVNWEKSGMQPSPGKSIKPLLQDKKLRKPFNESILIGKERHDVGRPDDYGYPIRGIIQDGYLYLRNYRPDLWPAGNPETGYPTVAGSPSKTAILNLRSNKLQVQFWEWSFGKRPDEELYNIIEDPYCLTNLANDSAFIEKRAAMSAKMEKQLRGQEDPRMYGNGEIFQKYPISNPELRNAYFRIVNMKEDFILPWVNESDVDSSLLSGARERIQMN